MKIDLTTRDGYDIATALRGPDDQHMDDLKWFFTAALRTMCDAVYPGVWNRTRPVSTDTAERIIADVVDSFGCYHYLRHQERALVALGQLKPELSGWTYRMTEAAIELQRLSMRGDAYRDRAYHALVDAITYEATNIFNSDQGGGK